VLATACVCKKDHIENRVDRFLSDVDSSKNFRENLSKFFSNYSKKKQKKTEKSINKNLVSLAKISKQNKTREYICDYAQSDMRMKGKR